MQRWIRKDIASRHTSLHDVIPIFVSVVVTQVYIVFIVIKAKVVGDLTWKYGDKNDPSAREAFRSAFILGPDDAVQALPNRTSIDAINTGYVSAFNKSYPLPYPAVGACTSLLIRSLHWESSVFAYGVSRKRTEPGRSFCIKVHCPKGHFTILCAVGSTPSFNICSTMVNFQLSGYHVVIL